MIIVGFVLAGVNVLILTVGGVYIVRDLLERHEMNRIRKQAEK